jgi:hypothetical protein
MKKPPVTMDWMTMMTTRGLMNSMTTVETIEGVAGRRDDSGRCDDGGNERVLKGIERTAAEEGEE